MRDQIDEHIELWSRELPTLDRRVEGIVTRMRWLHRHLGARLEQDGYPRRRLVLATQRPPPAHALKTDRIVLTYDAKARFSDLPGVSATGPTVAG